MKQNPVRRWRLDKKITQAVLAQYAYVSQARISQIESGGPIGGQLALRLAGLTGIPLGILMTRNRSKK